MTDFTTPAALPETGRAWVLERRGEKNALDPFRPYAFLHEEERSPSGSIEGVSTIFLTNRECPWHCLMCDLWKNTLDQKVPRGAIAAQIEFALAQLPAAKTIKLYNAGSFFDTRAIPPGDHAGIAQRLASFERIIVECHPALVGDECARFNDRLSGRLEVAMGLETVHPEILQKLGKGMTVELFRSAAARLTRDGIAVRSFVLVGLPFLSPELAPLWAARSALAAFESGAESVSLIPTRTGNGALDALEQSGHFREPHLAELESAAEQALAVNRGRVFADLWDLERFSRCPACYPARLTRLETMNREQIVPTPIECGICAVPAVKLRRARERTSRSE